MKCPKCGEKVHVLYVYKQRTRVPFNRFLCEGCEKVYQLVEVSESEVS